MISIDEHGTIYYKDNKGDLHRENGPAVKYKNGYKEWWVNGEKIKESDIASFITKEVMK